MKKKYSFLKETLKGTKELIILILILTIVSSKLNVYVPMFIQYALDGIVLENESVIPNWIRNLFFADTPIMKLMILSVVLILVNTAIFIVKYSRDKISTKFNLRINRNVKLTILKHVSKLEYGEFSRINHSDVIQRVNNDAITYAEFFNSQMNLFLDTIFIVSFSMLQVFSLSKIVGIFIFVICGLIVLLSLWYYKASKPLVEDTVEANKLMIEKSKNVLQNSKMQKIFNRKNSELESFKTMNEDYRKKDIKLGRFKVVYGIGTHTIRNFKEPFILLLGGILVVRGEMTLATISILLTYATKISDYIYDTVDKLKDVNQFLVSYEKLSNLMKVQEENEQEENRKLQGNIVFKDVTIKLSNRTILENINLEIKQGENIAIIGDNGARKNGAC